MEAARFATTVEQPAVARKLNILTIEDPNIQEPCIWNNQMRGLLLAISWLALRNSLWISHGRKLFYMHLWRDI